VGDGPLAEHCTALAQSLNVDLELTGQLPDDLVGEVLSVNDLFLVPTMAETFFLGAAEALAAGRPVVTSDRGAHTSFLDPSVTEIVSQDDPLTWARAVIDVMHRCEGLTAQDIQDTLPRAFSPEEVAGAYGRAYEAAISVHSR
jgi:glycosyltransferase